MYIKINNKDYDINEIEHIGDVKYNYCVNDKFWTVDIFFRNGGKSVLEHEYKSELEIQIREINKRRHHE